jgi:hypothetical protein
MVLLLEPSSDIRSLYCFYLQRARRSAERLILLCGVRPLYVHVIRTLTAIRFFSSRPSGIYVFVTEPWLARIHLDLVLAFVCVVVLPPPRCSLCCPVLLPVRSDFDWIGTLRCFLHVKKRRTRDRVLARPRHLVDLSGNGRVLL